MSDDKNPTPGLPPLKVDHNAPTIMEGAPAPMPEPKPAPKGAETVREGENSAHTEPSPTETVRQNTVIRGSKTKSSGIIGKTLGKYTIVRRIGSGGMGTAYEAHDQELQRKVALKVMNAAPDQEVKDLFRKEGITVAKLRHPNIVVVHEMAEVEGTWFIAMEYLEGETLEDALATKKLSLRQRKEIFAKILSAMAYAHTMGIVHRDLKPANIILRVGEGGTVEPVIIDFGLALMKKLGKDALAGRPAGTPNYMAPEQVPGEGIGPWTDVHALATILWELLAGQLPVESHGEDAWVYLERRMGILEKGIPDFPKDFSPAIQEILTNGMALDPANRYHNAAEFKAAMLVVEAKEEAERLRELEIQRGKLLEQRKELKKQIYLSTPTLSHLVLKKLSLDHQDLPELLAKRRLIDIDARLKNTLLPAIMEIQGKLRHLLRDALRSDPQHLETRQLLAAELMGDWRNHKEYGRNKEAGMVAQEIVELDPSWEDELRESGTLSLASDPPGAKVYLARYQEHDGVMKPSSKRLVGTTPLENIPYAKGAYQVTMEVEGYPTLIFPVTISFRRRNWTQHITIPKEVPGNKKTTEVLGALVYIPKTWAWLGQKPPDDNEDYTGCLKEGGREQGNAWVQQYPATFALVLWCLNRLLSKLQKGNTWERIKAYIPRDASGDCVAFDTSTKTLTLSRPEWQLHFPSVGISHRTARLVARLLSRELGVNVQLLREELWETIAQGPEFTPYPWGYAPDSTHTWVGTSVAFHKGEKLRLKASGECAVKDASPFGNQWPGQEAQHVRCLAGVVSEWVWEHQKGVAGWRKGNWNSALDSVNLRRTVVENERRRTLGFRLYIPGK